MRPILILCLASILPAAGIAAELDGLHWRDDCEDLARWTPQPDWLSNPGATADLAGDGRAICFRVDEPGRGMKWSLPVPPVEIDVSPWLVVRYRAENLRTEGTDYLIYADDGISSEQLNAIRLGDAESDGRWHVAAVDLGTLTEGEAVSGLAVQVQADPAGRARLWVDWLTLTDAPPPGAELIRRGPAVPPEPDWTAPLAELRWEAQPSWLANPADEESHRVERSDRATVFRVRPAGRGMKWSCGLPEPVRLAGHRYVSLRYRATGWRGTSDYAVCVFGRSAEEDDPGYAAMVPAEEVAGDGRWHTLNLDVRRLAARYPTIDRLAVQVQGAAAGASLAVSDFALLNARRPGRLSDAVNWQAAADFHGFRAIGLTADCRADAAAWRRAVHLDGWFDATAITAEGIPFRRVMEGPELAATSLRDKAELRLPADGRASEIYVLLVAVLTGADEPAYGGGRFRAIRDVDRFRLRIEYTDGTADECLPMNVATRRFGISHGVQVVGAAADPSKVLRAVVVCDRARQGAFAVAAVSVRTDGERLLPEALEAEPPLRVAPAAAGRPVRLEAEVDVTGPPAIGRLFHRPTGWELLDGPCTPVALRVDGREVPPEALRRLPPEQGPANDDFAWYAVESVEGLRLGLDMRPVPSAGDSLRFSAAVVNGGRAEHRVSLVAPAIGPYRLGEDAAEAYYLVPKCGAALDNRPCAYRERYCGLFPVQFLDTFCPTDGRGLVLRTEDTACLRKRYLLEKEDGRFTLGVEYPERTLAPGERLVAAPAVVTATDGDWHRGLEAYRAWVRTWYQARSPRKAWFREVFNFRQRFLWGLDPLADADGTLHLDRAVEEARREFGGIDYLHLFDWGYVPPFGRIYGRTGDWSPYERFRDGLREAIAGVQAQGVPVGLYIEGYLLQEKGRLGQEFGPAWQLVGPRGDGLYWPESTEMFICPRVDAWREVQASTYAAKVRELDVDGMYLDQFGFANAGKDCWSGEHGHGVPSYAVAAERDATGMVRDRIDGVKPGVALYTEETPVDVTSQFQDGSFTYAMNRSQRTETRVPLNVARFALPGFKTIEILYCDKPTGSWATGVRRVFFCGEAVWLEGPADEWFEPETRETIRRCYRILREHGDAFTTLEPEPLVPTELGGVYANRFPAEGKTVYTLYNARHRTVRGDVLRLPHLPGATYYDAWHERPAEVRREGPFDAVRLEIGPHGAGCVVMEGGELGDRDLSMVKE